MVNYVLESSFRRKADRLLQRNNVFACRKKGKEREAEMCLSQSDVNPSVFDPMSRVEAGLVLFILSVVTKTRR